MRTATVEYKVYKFNELSERAKEQVKDWYLIGQEPYIFTDDCKQDLENLFGKNDLDVQYSLAYCQGDGFNIYGKISAKAIFKCLENHNGGSQLEKFEHILTDEEKHKILEYAEECGEIEIPQNRHYNYCIANHVDITDDWAYNLKYYAGIENIDKELLEKFERLVINIFEELCKCYEKMGYEFFYEISDEDLEEVCEVNEYEFLENGELFS